MIIIYFLQILTHLYAIPYQKKPKLKRRKNQKVKSKSKIKFFPPQQKKTMAQSMKIIIIFPIIRQ